MHNIGGFSSSILREKGARERNDYSIIRIMVIKREIVAEYLRFRIIFSACKLRITKFLEKKRRRGGGKAVRGGGDNPTENLIKSGPQKNWFHRGGGSNETPLVILGGHLIRSLSTDLTAFLLLGWSRSWGPMALIPSRSPPPSSPRSIAREVHFARNKHWHYIAPRTTRFLKRTRLMQT